MVIPGNGDVFYVVTLLKALLGYVQTIFQGENFDSDLCGWIRQRRRLSVASFLKALLLKNIGLHVMSMVGADMVLVVVCPLLI